MALILGKYEVIRRLARGGMGEVLLAREPAAGGRLVALKALLPHLADEPGVVERFAAEARVATALRHDNIVATEEAGQSDGNFYIVMEYVRGAPLSDVLRATSENGARIPIGVATRVICDVLVGLSYAHEAVGEDGAPLGIIHRDISPTNIMVSSSGVTKILDFGIAKSRHARERTATGVLKGKVRHMAPEQANGESVDGRADLFSAGTVFWEMMTGEPLLPGDDVQALTALVLGPLRAPSEVVDDVPPALSAIVMTMLERDPARRHPSCAAAARALSTWLEASGAGATRAEVAAWLAAAVPEVEGTLEAPAPPPAVAPSGGARRARGVRRVPLALAGAMLAVPAVVLAAIAFARAPLSSVEPTEATAQPAAAAAAAAAPAPALALASPPEVPSAAADRVAPAVAQRPPSRRRGKRRAPSPASAAPQASSATAAASPDPLRLNSALLKRSIDENLGPAARCTNTNIKPAPTGSGLLVHHCPSYRTVAGDRVVVLRVTPDGVVEAARFSDATDGARIEACFLESVKAWRFPRFRGDESVEVTQRVVFEPCVPINGKCVF